MAQNVPMTDAEALSQWVQRMGWVPNAIKGLLVTAFVVGGISARQEFRIQELERSRMALESRLEKAGELDKTWREKVNERLTNLEAQGTYLSKGIDEIKGLLKQQ